MRAATSIVRPLRDIHFPGICPLYTCSGAPRTDEDLLDRNERFPLDKHQAAQGANGGYRARKVELCKVGTRLIMRRAIDKDLGNTSRGSPS